MVTKTREKIGTLPLEVVLVPLDLIDDNPWQPRSTYPHQDIEELATSIDRIGLRQIPEGRQAGERYQLAYGHKRLRAYIRLAKKHPEKYGRFPIRVARLTDDQMLTYAMEEHRRRDVKPIDVARSIDKYLVSHSHITEQKMAEMLQMTQPNVSNMRRVLKLPEEILAKVDDGRINFTMARELLVFLEVDNALSLMRETIRSLATPDGAIRTYGSHPCTVEGIRKSIDYVCAVRFPCLIKHAGSSLGWRYEKTLFDAGGCQDCPRTITTHPAKSGKSVYCVDEDCWRKKQAEHKKSSAKQAVARVLQDVTAAIASDAVISQEITDGDLDAFRQAVEAEAGSVPAQGGRQPESGDQAGSPARAEASGPEMPAELRQLIEAKGRYQGQDPGSARSADGRVFRRAEGRL